MNREVTIIAEESVDPKFGTGVVQICTYGDKEDVKTVIKHKLPVIRLINETGKITEAGCKYAGLYLNQARAAIVADLTAAGLLEKTEKIQQEVGVCDRCKTHVEILERQAMVHENHGPLRSRQRRTLTKSPGTQITCETA